MTTWLPTVYAVARLLDPPTDMANPIHGRLAFRYSHSMNSVMTKVIVKLTKPWVTAAVSLGLCGLRMGEVFGLAWSDIDLASGRVRVRQALWELDDGTRQLGPVKTRSGRREIPLPCWSRAALRAHLDDQLAPPHPTRLVFTTFNDTPQSPSNFRARHYRPLVQRAGLPGLTFHAMRHSAATLLLAAGADIKSAQRILGHSKASHTLDIYADFVPDRVDAAMECLEAAIEEASAGSVDGGGAQTLP